MTAASDLNIGTLAGQNKFTLQYARTGDPDIIVKSLLDLENGFAESPFFTPLGGGLVQLQVQANAPKTSSSASGPRAELREADLDGSDIHFSPFDGNTHYIKATLRITHHPLSGPSIDGIGITLMQLHNGDSDRLTIRTQFVTGSLRLRARVNGVSTGGEVVTGFDASGTNVINRDIPCMLKIYGGNGTSCTAEIYVIDMVTPFVTTTALNSTNATGEGWYLKTGCYANFDATKVSSTEYAQVTIRDLEHWHTGWPEPGSGGGQDPGGGTGLPATVRQVVSNSSNGLSGNLSVTTATTTAVGDTLVVWEMREYGNSGDMPPPTGTAGTWTTRIATPINDVALSCFTRPVTIGGAQTITVTGNADTPGCVLVAVVVKDCTAVGAAAGANSATSGTTHTAPTVTAVDSNELLLCAFAASEVGNYNVPTGMTSIVTPTTGVDGGTSVTMQVCAQALTAPGATGTRLATFTPAANQATGSIALRGSTAPATPTGLWLPFFN